MAASATVGILRVLLSANTAEFESAMASAGKSMGSLQREFSTIGQQATAAGTLLTGAFTVPLAAIGVGATKAAMDFETAFADVAKTVDGVAEATGKLTPKGDALAMAFRDIAKEIPVSVAELSKIAAIGGQMDVPIDKLKDFTFNVAVLGVAVDGISAEDAAVGLAQIGNAAGVGTSQIAEMASTLVHLGNNSAATERGILELTQRLIGAGTTVGMTIPQVMTLATTMANVGIEAEKGGTAMSTVIQKIGVAVSTNSEKLQEFAAVAGQSAQQFAETWKRSPVEAIQLVIEGLGRMKENGTDLNLTMIDLGLKGIRVSDVMKLVAGNTGDVAKTLAIANEGWIAGDKHIDEFQKKAATTANELKVLWQRVYDLGITLGGVFLPLIKQAVAAVEFFIPVIQAVVNAFAAMPQPVQIAVIAIGGLLAAIGPVLVAFGLMVTAITPLLPLFVALVPTISGVVAAIMGIGTVILGFISGPVLLIGAAIAGLTVVWLTWGEDIKRITAEALSAVAGFFAPALQGIATLWTNLKTSVVTTASSMMQSVRDWLVTFWEGSIFQSVARMLQAMLELWVALRTRVIIEVTQLAAGVYKWLVEQFAPIVDGVKAFLTILADGWKAFSTAVIARVTETYTAVKSWLQDKLAPVFTAIQAFFTPVLAAWTTAKNTVIGIATALYEGVKTWLVDKFVAIVDGIKAKIDAVTGFFKDMKDKVVGHSYVVEMVDLIGFHIARLDSLMVQPVLKYTDGVGDLFAGMKQESLGLMGQLVDGVGAQTARYPDVLMNPTEKASGITQTIFGAMSTGIQGIVGTLFNRVQGQTTSWGGAFTGTISGISGATQGIFNSLSQSVQQIVGGMFNSLLGQATNWGGMFMGILNNIIGAGISSLVSWGLSQLGRLIGNWAGGGEEGTQVNPARNQFLSQFGGPGTGEGSGFWNLGVALEQAGANAEDLHRAMREADTMAEFNAAVAAINAALGGGGAAPSFPGGGGGGGVMAPGGQVVPAGGVFVNPDGSIEMPEDVPGIHEMAAGGFGTVRRPTLFMAGEEGPEDFAFSGANKSFAGQAPITVNFNGPVFGEEEYIQTTVVDQVLNAIRMNRNGALTRFQAVAEIG
jgi:TP901 family phage tail tape measure protein